ncbi:hypothetical protein H4219_000199 [Mycoemilia scoparia]|uniref:Uncharacterized protein n=1 Tax=Mycoemilia scoparia TaxID=417184 RepID=A0A9W8AA44_9FUNG|nr:hypothetical protein H4219_000199 [Mycoemilia scoparia]
MGVEFKSPELGKDKFGYGGDGQVVGVEECGERIDRLLRKVQQSRREATVRREISSSTIAPGTPTRFDIDYHPGEFGTNTGKRHQDTHRQRSKTICIESPMSTVRVKQLEQPKTTSNDKNTPAPAKNNTQAKPQRVSTTDIRKKLEALREKRRKAQMPDSILSPRSLSEKSPCTRGPSGGLGIVGDPEPMDDTDDSSSTQVDFFDQESVVAMFQEIPLQLKDPDWDKRVYYHHISQTNDEYKRLVDDIKILDCRDECLTEMVGSRRAEKLRLPSPKDLIKSGDAPNITLRNRQSHSSPHRPELNSASDSKEATSSTDSESTFSVFPNSNSIDLSADFWLEQQPGKPMPTSPLGVGEDNIEAITEWLEEDSDGEGSDSTSDVDLSFDWTRDGFGYMEFRRLSRMPANSQQAQDSEKTPKHSAPPSNTTTPATGLRYAMNDNRPATQLLKPGEHRVSMSTIMEASHERDSCSVAMASLNQNIKSPLLPSQHVKGATPTATQAPLPAPEGKAPLAAMSKNPTSISSFASPFLSQHQHQPRNSYEAMQINLVHKLRKENEYLKSEVQQTKSAIAALTRLVLRHQENFYSNVDSIRTQLGQLSISPPASPSQAYDP